MWWAFCSKVTPLMIPSLPHMWCITVSFFHFPRFYSSPMISKISSMSVAGVVLLLTQQAVCIHASIFSTHAVLLSVAGAVCFLRRCLLLFALPHVCSVPRSTRLGSRLIPPLCHFWGISRGSFSFACLCQLSLSQAVWSLEFCIVSCRVNFMSLMTHLYSPPHHGDLERLNCHLISSLARWSCSQFTTKISLFSPTICLFFYCGK